MMIAFDLERQMQMLQIALSIILLKYRDQSISIFCVAGEGAVHA